MVKKVLFVVAVAVVCAAGIGYALDNAPKLVRLHPAAINTVSTVLAGDYPEYVHGLAVQVLCNNRKPSELRGAIDLWDALQKRTKVKVPVVEAPELGTVQTDEIIEVKIPEMDHETSLDLGVCIRAEADVHIPDYAPIAYTLLRRMTLYNRAAGKLGRKPRTYRDQIRAYCQVFNRDSPLYDDERRVNIRASTFRNPQHGTIEEWAEIEDFIYSWEVGAVSDPCPTAWIWGGKAGVDPIPEGWVQVACGGTSNRFLKRAK